MDKLGIGLLYKIININDKNINVNEYVACYVNVMWVRIYVCVDKITRSFNDWGSTSRDSESVYVVGFVILIKLLSKWF